MARRLGFALAAALVAGASAFVSLPTTTTARARVRPAVRMGASGSEAELTRAQWLQGLAGVAGAGLVGVGGQRAVQARDNDVLVRRPVFSERLFDTRRRSYLPVDVGTLQHNKALDQPVICVGEVHDDDCHHHAEYAILKAVHARHVARGGGPLAVGLEMMYRQHQPILDEYVFGGRKSLESLKADTRWDDTWGYKLSHYSKILNYARMHGIRVVGLNVPQPVIQVVRKLGLERVPPELKRRLPEVDLSNAEHRESFMAMMRYFAGVHGGGSAHKGGGGGGGGGISEDALYKMYQAQTLWDEYMAESASNFLRDNAGSRMVVMAGTNHIQNRYGIPDRITRRLGVPVFTVVPISVAFDSTGLPAIDEPYDSSFADWLYFVERQPEGGANAA